MTLKTKYDEMVEVKGTLLSFVGNVHALQGRPV